MNDWDKGYWTDWVYIDGKWNRLEISRHGAFELFHFNGVRCTTGREATNKIEMAKAELKFYEMMGVPGRNANT